jgi:hypothetical protein
MARRTPSPTLQQTTNNKYRISMSYPHAVVWIDHDEAHVIQFDADASEELTIRSKHRNGHLHHKAGQCGSGHAPEDHAYHREVEQALADAGEILIVGPSNERIELEKHMKQHAKGVFDRVIGVEPADHPSDGQVLKLARRFFRAADRMGSVA